MGSTVWTCGLTSSASSMDRFYRNDLKQPNTEPTGLPTARQSTPSCTLHTNGNRNSMANAFADALKRWRENFYISRALSSVAKPVHSISLQLAHEIEKKVKRNGFRIRLQNGVQMRIARDAGVGVATSLFWHGPDGHEPESSRLLRFFFERSDTFVDVGAHYGFYSVLAALWNPQLQVVAFEPMLPIWEGLKRNVALNHLERNIVCENLALSSRSGTATFYLPPAEGMDVASTGTLADNGWQVRQKAQPLQVETIRLDDYELRHPMRVDLIKIDVEDFEAEALRGMERIIRRDKPFIVCEILPRNREHKNENTRRVIEMLNYTPFWVTSAGYIRVSRFDFERPFTNFLLSPVATEDEVLQDPAVLWERRGSAALGVGRADPGRVHGGT
jgi:FkbM family methyltransferase